MVKTARTQQHVRPKTIRRRDGADPTALGVSVAPRDTPARLVELQRIHGNAYVSRLIANNRVAEATGRPLQRDAAAPVSLNPRAASAPAGGDAAAADPATALGDGWKPIYKLISEQLGEDKLKEYGKTLAGKGVDVLISQAKGAKPDDFLAKAQVDLLGTMLADHAKTVAEEWVASPAGKAFRERLLTITKEAPGVVVAAAIAAVAAAYLANPDLPEIKKKFDVFKGMSADAMLDIGKLQELAVQKASLALKYSTKHVDLNLKGSYADEEQKKPGYTAGGGVALKGKDFKFKSDLTLDTEGKVTLDLGQAIDVGKFGMETGVSISGGDMAAIVAVKVGDKETYVSGKTRVEADGKVSLELDFKGGGLEIGGKAKDVGGAGMAGQASLKGKDIFNFKGLDATANVSFGAGGVKSAGGSISYSTDTKVGKVFLNVSGETMHAGADKDKATPIGFQGVVGVGIRFGGTK